MTPLQKLRARKQAIDAIPHVPNNRIVVHHSKCQPIICTTNGKRWPSIVEAAQWLTEQIQERCLPSALGQSIRRGKGHYKGFHFKYEKEQQ